MYSVLPSHTQPQCNSIYCLKVTPDLPRCKEDQNESLSICLMVSPQTLKN